MNQKCLPFIRCNFVLALRSVIRKYVIFLQQTSEFILDIWDGYILKMFEKCVCACVCLSMSGCTPFKCRFVHNISLSQLPLLLYIYLFISLSTYIPASSQHLINCSVCGLTPQKQTPSLSAIGQYLLQTLNATISRDCAHEHFKHTCFYLPRHSHRHTNAMEHAKNKIKYDKSTRGSY